MARKFEMFMLHVTAGTNEKLAILTDSEYRAHISGILAVAATSPIRGRLLVGDMEAEPQQVAKKAGVSVAVAKSAMSKMRKVGVLYRDEDLNCWAVHDWEKLNPEPKADPTAAERQRRLRERRKAEGDGGVTPPVTVLSRRDGRDGNGAVTPPEVEGENNKTPLPPDGGFPEPPRKPSSGRRRDLDEYDLQVEAYAAWLLPDLAEPHRTQTVRSALGGAVPEPRTNERVAEWVRRFEQGAAA
jgi:hypothetical protein